jgi:hypothetical protein
MELAKEESTKAQKNIFGDASTSYKEYIFYFIALNLQVTVGP